MKLKLGSDYSCTINDETDYIVRPYHLQPVQPIEPSTRYDDVQLDRDKFKQFIDNPQNFKWMEWTLKYALKWHDSVRQSGASDVMLFESQEGFNELWIKKDGV